MSPLHVVVMGVSGCGKSAVGEALALRLGLPLVEGDRFHSPGSMEKMQHGVALTDSDRAGWLALLGQELSQRPDGAVLTCSALKRHYRDSLRAAAPGVRFVHLALGLQDALERVSQRVGHFYPASLVASQFEALEDPSREPGVVVVDAMLDLPLVVERAAQGIQQSVIDYE